MTTAVPLRDPLRRPHRDLRRLVEREGQEAPRVLYAYFDAFNRAFFGAQLGDPLIWISQTSSPRALGDYIGRDVHGLRSRIRIAPATFRRGLRRAVAVLLHEMVHAWCAEVLRDEEDGYKGHGPKFAAKCNEIGQQLGFPECAPKGRGGKARAECWPDLPAVEGEELAPPRSPRAPKVAPDDGGDRDGGDVAGADARDVERDAVVRFLSDAADALRAGGKGKTADRVAALARDIGCGLHRED